MSHLSHAFKPVHVAQHMEDSVTVSMLDNLKSQRDLDGKKRSIYLALSKLLRFTQSCSKLDVISFVCSSVKRPHYIHLRWANWRVRGSTAERRLSLTFPKVGTTLI